MILLLQPKKNNDFSYFSLAVVQQFYNSRVIDEYVLKGNTGILKCLVPSFVSDFVQIIAWVADDGTTYDFETSKYFNSGNFRVGRPKTPFQQEFTDTKT